jgi:hypothetical protein
MGYVGHFGFSGVVDGAGVVGAGVVAAGVVAAGFVSPGFGAVGFFAGSPPQPSVISPRLNAKAQAKNRFIVPPFLSRGVTFRSAGTTPAIALAF